MKERKQRIIKRLASRLAKGSFNILFNVSLFIKKIKAEYKIDYNKYKMYLL